MASNEIIKKVMFGGFRREDVINYIEGLQQQLFQAEQRAQEAENRALALQGKERENANLAKALEQEKQRSRGLETEKNDAEAKAEGYLAKLAECDKKLLALQEKLGELEESCAGITSSEQQINNLVMDAVMYSDKIIGKAKDAAQAVSQDAKQAISATAQDIESIGSEIGRISGDFGDIITRLSAKLGVLSDEITKLNARFEPQEDDADEGQFRLGEDGLLLLDELYMKKRQKEPQKNG